MPICPNARRRSITERSCPTIHLPLPKTDENALYRAVAQVGLGNNVEAGLPVLAREIERQKPREAEFYIVLGDGLKGTGKIKEAIAAYEEGGSSAAGFGASAASAGECPRGVRGVVAATEMLERAIQLAPSDPETWYRYGILDSSSGRMTQAIDRIQKAIVLDPSLPEKSRTLAEILIKAGQRDRAQAALRDALRIDPYDDDAWNLSGRILAEKGEIAEAMYDFERAIRLRPGAAVHLYDYALALARADRFDEAQGASRSGVTCRW